MISSMTGYGISEKVSGEWTVRAEVRSVNHGELKVVVHLPDMLRLRESDLVNLVRARLARGHVTLDVRCNLAESALGLLVDRQRLRGYVSLAREIAGAEGAPLQVELGSVLSLPGVMSADLLPDRVREALWPLVVETSEGALGGLIGMRRAEGQNLAGEIEAICGRIVDRTVQLGGRVEESVRAGQARLVERIQRLLGGTGVVPDADALAREVALLAERSDVSEEVARIKSHVQQFREAMTSEGEPVGKKLEFLVQEMLREANTMAAKLPSSELVREAVEIKTDVHRLREQVRNVE